jgi:ABC-type transporter Mla subunit MlaD
MPELGVSELLSEIRRLAGTLQELVERERRLQRDVADRLLAPIDAIFDLLGQSAAMLQQQADALASAGRALEDAARVMRHQAQLFDQTVGALHEPVQLMKAAAGPAREPTEDAP